jgi:hypothetical protein
VADLHDIPQYLHGNAVTDLTLGRNYEYDAVESGISPIFKRNAFTPSAGQNIKAAATRRHDYFMHQIMPRPHPFQLFIH